MRCGHCGEPLPADALFCGECGRAVQAGPTTPRSPRVSMVTPITPPPSGPPVVGDPPPRAPGSPTVIIEPISTVDRVVEPIVEPIAEPVEAAETSGTGSASDAPVPPSRATPPATTAGGGAGDRQRDELDDLDDVDDDPTTISPRRVPPAVSATIVASTGQRFQVGGRVLLGRRPISLDGEEYDAVLVIVDEGKTVSKTHLELIVDRDSITVIDLGSGNGTIIETPGEPPVRCVAGMPHPVPRGSRLVLGRQFLMIA